LVITVKTELKEVGQDEVGEGVSVALELVRGLDVLELFFGGVLRLDVADYVLFAVPDAEVRIPCLGFLGQGRDVDAPLSSGIGKGLDELFQVGVKALFAGVSALGRIKYSV
jgi:hypothetical protein